MLRALVGDLFASDAQTYVNTVNCVGIMGKGIALEFKKRYPDMFEDYAARCVRHEVRLGEPYLYRRLFPPNVLNFPTKDHWRSVSKLSDVIAGLDFLEQHYQEWGITSLAVPPLGCGQGQLEWRVVGPTLYRHLSRLNIPVELYAPAGTLDQELDVQFLSQDGADVLYAGTSVEPPRINPAWVALVEVLARINAAFYHWPVGRTRFQKLAYFATEAGLPTELHFTRGSYGPFASELKPLITKLVNNGLLREEDYGQMFVLKPGPTYSDAIHASLYHDALQQWEPAIERIVDLLLRLSTRDTEVAATVHCAWSTLTQESHRRVTETEVLDEVKRWKQRRNPLLDDDAIVQSIRDLHLLRWMDVKLDASALLDESDLLIGV